MLKQDVTCKVAQPVREREGEKGNVEESGATELILLPLRVLMSDCLQLSDRGC